MNKLFENGCSFCGDAVSNNVCANGHKLVHRDMLKAREEIELCYEAMPLDSVVYIIQLQKNKYVIVSNPNGPNGWKKKSLYVFQHTKRYAEMEFGAAGS